MEKERDDYQAHVNTFLESFTSMDDQGWRRSKAILGQTQSGQGHNNRSEKIETLRRTADAYFSKVDGRIGRIRRVMAMMQVDLPVIQGLPRGSWEFQNKIQVEQWVEDTKREFHGWGVHEHLMDLLDVLDHEFDKDVEAWIEKIQQQRVTEYCGRVRKSIMLAKRIIEFLNSWNHPSINDVPRGALDSTHKAQIEAWVQGNACKRRDYANRVAAAIRDMREVLDDEKVDTCLHVDEDKYWMQAIDSLQSKADGYCLKVDKNLKSANRMLDVFYLSAPPSTDLPMVSLDENHKEVLESWIGNTGGERREYCARVMGAVENMKEEIKLRKEDAGPQNEASVDDEEKMWDGMVSTLERTMDEYCSKVDENIGLARRVVDYVNREVPLSVEDLLRISVMSDIKTKVRQEALQGFCRFVGGDGRKEIPDELRCPITKEVMVDPVFTADGHTYERSAIERVFADIPSGENPISPVTGLVLPSRSLIPNIAIRSQCMDYRQGSE